MQYLFQSKRKRIDIKRCKTNRKVFCRTSCHCNRRKEANRNSLFKIGHNFLSSKFNPQQSIAVERLGGLLTSIPNFSHWQPCQMSLGRPHLELFSLTITSACLHQEWVATWVKHSLGFPRLGGDLFPSS